MPETGKDREEAGKDREETGKRQGKTGKRQGRDRERQGRDGGTTGQAQGGIAEPGINRKATRQGAGSGRNGLGGDQIQFSDRQGRS